MCNGRKSVVLRATLVTEELLDKLGRWLSERKGTKDYRLYECEELVDAANKFYSLVGSGVPVSRFAERMTKVPKERPKHIADVILRKRTNLNNEDRRENISPKTLINFARSVYEIYYQDDEHDTLHLLMKRKSYNAFKQAYSRILQELGYEKVSDDVLGIVMESSLDEGIKVVRRSKYKYNSLTELADIHEWSNFRKMHAEIQGNIDEKRVQGLRIDTILGGGIHCSVEMKTSTKSNDS